VFFFFVVFVIMSLSQVEKLNYVRSTFFFLLPFIFNIMKCTMLLCIFHFTGVREAWEGKNVFVLLSKLGPFKIFFEDIRKTAPSVQIESEVSLSCFMGLLFISICIYCIHINCSKALNVKCI